MRSPLYVALALVLVACASRPPAPVEERSGRPAVGRALAPGQHRVSRGDTLYAIAFTHGLDYRLLARWNGLQPPFVIYPGQDLRLSPPAVGKTPAAPDRKAAQAAPAPARPKAAPAKDVSGAAGNAKPGLKAAPAPADAATQPPTQPPASGDPAAWRWPVEGRIARGFLASDPSRNGIDIAAQEGEPVRASASGTVVYSGNGLIGYGELIIIKHSDRMLSAYGHNRQRLVAEGDSVKAGQKIAELGRNDHNEAVLHFEIRINGKPVNPLEHLPRR